jgi:branched-chain amino acid transport system ATP-binding protein
LRLLAKADLALTEGEQTVQISVDGIGVRYGGAVALDGVSLTVADGAGVAIVGRNGAGKTSLLRVLAGATRPQHGKVVVDEQRGRWDVAAAVRRGVRFVPESGNIFPHLNVLENLRSGWPFGPRRQVAERVEEVFEFFPILQRLRGRRAGNLSGGERQALAVGRALVGQVKVLILDEPSLGLSPLLGAELFERLDKIRKATGMSIVVAEQNLAFVEQLCERVCWIETGRVRVLGDTAELADRIRSEVLT